MVKVRVNRPVKAPTTDRPKLAILGGYLTEVRLCHGCDFIKPAADFSEHVCNDCAHDRKTNTRMIISITLPNGDNVEAKGCTQCSHVKLVDDFSTVKNSPTGRRSNCKRCNAEGMSARRGAQPPPPRFKVIGADGEVYEVVHCSNCRNPFSATEVGRYGGFTNWCTPCAKAYFRKRAARKPRKFKFAKKYRIGSVIVAKKCTGCQEDKPLDDFHKDKRSSDGRRSICKLCANQITKEYDWKKKHLPSKVSKIMQ